jgi:hypothetical protein
MKARVRIGAAVVAVLLAALAAPPGIRAEPDGGAPREVTRRRGGWRTTPNAPSWLPPGGPIARPGATFPRPAPPPAAPPAPAAPAAQSEPTHVPDAPVETCKRPPRGTKLTRITLKPDAELGEILVWISSITCKQFILPGTIPANGKKVTLIVPRMVTVEKAYQLFLSSLDAAGLTVEPTGAFLRIIESSKAKSSAIPVYIDDGGAAWRAPAPDAIVTRFVRVEHADPARAADQLRPLVGERGNVVVATTRSLIITGPAVNVDRAIEALADLDRASP